MTADSKQVSGDHYKVDYQHWNMLLSLGFGPEYYIGQATKYLTRWRKKNGLRDLLKAQHFIEKLLEVAELRGNHFLPYGHVCDEDLQGIIVDHMRNHLNHYFHVNDLDRDTMAICVSVMFANSTGMLIESVKECALLVDSERLKDVPSKDVEQPVSVNFDFIGYIGDGVGIKWRCKRCGNVLDLALDEPPATTHQCQFGRHT